MTLNQVAIIYWSGTGNTEKMARCVAEGVAAAGGTAELLLPGKVQPAALGDFQVWAFGCPAMGDEVLEETEFAPMFEVLEGALAGRKTALFGSYGWGDGQWLRDWAQRCTAAGAALYEQPGLMIHEAPDAEGEEACRELGRKLAAW